uniref:Peroxisomal membrane protein PEX14-like KPWE domain-containing protein n=1 Tax=Salarias fasciatus TaxID=181472 RepID=A0A672IAK3_SALFA
MWPPPLPQTSVDSSGSSAQTEQLSFAEVMRLIQEGKEVPGVTKLDVQPSNQSPTPSRMTRILKPWETEMSVHRILCERWMVSL